MLSFSEVVYVFLVIMRLILSKNNIRQTKIDGNIHHTLMNNNRLGVSLVLLVDFKLLTSFD